MSSPKASGKIVSTLFSSGKILIEILELLCYEPSAAQHSRRLSFVLPLFPLRSVSSTLPPSLPLSIPPFPPPSPALRLPPLPSLLLPRCLALLGTWYLHITSLENRVDKHFFRWPRTSSRPVTLFGVLEINSDNSTHRARKEVWFVR